jgi:dihydrolipoamide dehydrogenase
MHLVRDRAAEFGVRGVDPAALSFDLAKAVARKDRVVSWVHAGVYKALNHNKNISFVRGHAEFTSPGDLRVDGQVFSVEKTILANGAQAAPPDIPGLDEAGYITNDEALKLDRLPASMIVIGGG